MSLRLTANPTVPWKDALPDGAVGEAVYFGRDEVRVGAVQVAVASVPARPTKAALAAMWKTRGANTAMPVLVAAVAPDGVWLYGPTADESPVGPISARQATLQLQSVLDEPHGIAANARIRAVQAAAAAVGEGGFSNHFLFSTYYLRREVPSRPDWADACARAATLVDKRGRDLVDALGFTSEPAAGGALVLRSASGSRRAVAVLLDESENFDAKSAKYQLSPVAHGLEVAGREEVPWVIVLRTNTLRLYPGRDGVGVGQRGQSETYFELDLALVTDDFAGLLPLVFSADALERDGSAERILSGSGKYAADLGERLRDRVYGEVVPLLATEVARRLPQLGLAVDVDGLQSAYALTMRILFRLLFQAYGEATELLPVDNENYRSKSLGRFVATLGDEAPEFSPVGVGIWNDISDVWRAIWNGDARWGIPAYGGSLFDPTSGEGVLLESLRLPDSVMGPALRAMLTEVTEDAVRGAVDFRSLQVREFGTIYEGLLESSLSLAEEDLALDKNGAFVPAQPGDDVVARAGEAYFHSASGERKATGSYYTPKIVVDHLIERSLEPAIVAHLARIGELMAAGREREASDAFFDFRVADLAMGSAHFLVAAVDKIERFMRDFLTATPVPGVRAELTRLAETAQRALREVSEAEVEITEAQLLRRQVARRCVYGLDINPLAVELSQLAIWIHTFVPGLPMASLDHNLVRANSLTGIGTIDEAIDALAVGDLLAPLIREPLDAARDLLVDYANASEADKAEVARGAETLERARAAAAPAKAVFDVAVAMRLGVVKAGSAFTQDDIDELAADPRVAAAVDPLTPAHMPYLFPEVFLRPNGGFDVLIGNPPWEELHVAEHHWWGLRMPGLRSMPQRDRIPALASLRQQRPDLEAAYQSDISAVNALRAAIASGPFPGVGAAHLDLYQMFAWRNWALARQAGAIGLVLPRSALVGASLSRWRGDVLTTGAFASVTFLVNNQQWVFPNVHPQYTVGLTVVRKEPSASIGFVGPFSSEHELTQWDGDVSKVKVADFGAWSDNHAFPLLPESASVEVLKTMMSRGVFSEPAENVEISLMQGDMNATKDKSVLDFDVSAPRDRVPVVTGASFNLWNPDAGAPYAYSPGGVLRPYLADKFDRASRSARSAYSGLSRHDADLPMDRARIAYRGIARATDTRTTIACLLPPGTAIVDPAHMLVMRQGGAKPQGFILGVMASIPFDWSARRWVELHLTFGILSRLPVPWLSLDTPLSDRVVEVAGRLAAVDGRYREWADEVGVPVGSAKDDAVKQDLIAELDALVSLLYGLTEEQVEHVFATFHRGWDYRPRLDAVLAHFARWKDAA